MTNKLLIIKSSSNCFWVSPPCTYCRQEEIAMLEEQENERSEVTSEWYEINGERFLKDYLAAGWMDTFQSILERRDKEIEVTATFTGTYSPREYNFETDAAKFNIEISLSDLRKIQEQVLAHEEVFDAYLHKYHSSYSGYRSFVPNNLTEWKYDYFNWTIDMEEEGFDPNNKWDPRMVSWRRAFWVLLDFWLFAFPQFCVFTGYGGAPEGTPPSLQTFEDNVYDFDKEYDNELDRLRGNGVISECFDTVPVEEADYVPV